MCWSFLGTHFLNTLCDGADLFQAFVSWCKYLHKKIAARTGVGKPGIQIVDFISNKVEKAKCTKYMRSCPLTGRYLVLRTLVAIQPQLDTSNPKNTFPYMIRSASLNDCNPYRYSDKQTWAAPVHTLLLTSKLQLIYYSEAAPVNIVQTR